jgi:hypothetical protein
MPMAGSAAAAGVLGEVENRMPTGCRRRTRVHDHEPLVLAARRRCTEAAAGVTGSATMEYRAKVRTAVEGRMLVERPGAEYCRTLPRTHNPAPRQPPLGARRAKGPGVYYAHRATLSRGPMVSASQQAGGAALLSAIGPAAAVAGSGPRPLPRLNLLAEQRHASAWRQPAAIPRRRTARPVALDELRTLASTWRRGRPRQGA